MNLYVFYKHISIMLFLQYTLAYLIPEASETDSESVESEIRHLRDDNESLHEQINEYKHLKSEKGAQSRRSINEEKSSNKKECAVMYRDEEPVGILQPYKNSYQFFPIHIDEQIPVEISPFKESQISIKRDTSSNTDEEEPSATGDETLKKTNDILKYADERYPYIFAKFKVDSRIGKADGISKQRVVQKRESQEESLQNERNVNSLSSTLTRIGTNDEGAELELRNILSDMGLIDDDSRVNKREAEAELNEDEDLEHGTNKINLIKLEDDNERKKREEHDKHAEQKEIATKHYEAIDIPEPKAASEEEYIDDYLNKNSNQDGELEQADQPDREKRSDKLADQMEREIKAKLQKIKEEVRDEIDKIKSSNNNNAEIVDDEAEEKKPIERKKRNVINTLVESETSEIDPVLSSENRLVPHIRRRRDVLNESVVANRDDTAFNTDEQLVELGSVLESLSENKTGNNLIIDLNPEIKTENIFDDSNDHDASTEEHFLIRNLKQYDELNTDDEHDDDVKENDKSFKFSLMEDDRLNREKKACTCSSGEKNCKCEKRPNKLVKGSDGSNFVYIDDVPRAMGKDQEYNPKETIIKRKVLSPIDTVGREARSPRNNNLNQRSRINLLKNGGYILDIAPDIYRITDENQETVVSRKKRNSFSDLVAIHGGGPVLNHLLAIRERSMLPRLRTKRTAKAQDRMTDQRLTLTDMSSEELFGGLPQGFEGALARHKRVKRTI